LSKLYDENKDYIINKNKSFYYFNIGNFGVTTCKKDNTYIVYVNEKDVNNTDCLLFSGTNKEKPSKWRIRSKKLSTMNNFNFIKKTFNIKFLK